MAGSGLERQYSLYDDLRAQEVCLQFKIGGIQSSLERAGRAVRGANMVARDNAMGLLGEVMGSMDVVAQNSQVKQAVDGVHEFARGQASLLAHSELLEGVDVNATRWGILDDAPDQTAVRIARRHHFAETARALGFTAPSAVVVVEAKTAPVKHVTTVPAVAERTLTTPAPVVPLPREAVASIEVGEIVHDIVTHERQARTPIQMAIVVSEGTDSLAMRRAGQPETVVPFPSIAKGSHAGLSLMDAATRALMAIDQHNGQPAKAHIVWGAAQLPGEPGEVVRHTAQTKVLRWLTSLEQDGVPVIERDGNTRSSTYTMPHFTIAGGRIIDAREPSDLVVPSSDTTAREVGTEKVLPAPMRVATAQAAERQPFVSQLPPDLGFTERDIVVVAGLLMARAEAIRISTGIEVDGGELSDVVDTYPYVAVDNNIGQQRSDSLQRIINALSKEEILEKILNLETTQPHVYGVAGLVDALTKNPERASWLGEHATAVTIPDREAHPRQFGRSGVILPAVHLGGNGPIANLGGIEPTDAQRAAKAFSRVDNTEVANDGPSILSSPVAHEQVVMTSHRAEVVTEVTTRVVEKVVTTKVVEEVFTTESPERPKRGFVTEAMGKNITRIRGFVEQGVIVEGTIAVLQGAMPGLISPKIVREAIENRIISVPGGRVDLTLEEVVRIAMWKGDSNAYGLRGNKKAIDDFVENFTASMRDTIEANRTARRDGSR